MLILFDGRGGLCRGLDSFDAADATVVFWLAICVLRSPALQTIFSPRPSLRGSPAKSEMIPGSRALRPPCISRAPRYLSRPLDPSIPSVIVASHDQMVGDAWAVEIRPTITVTQYSVSSLPIRLHFFVQTPLVFDVGAFLLFPRLLAGLVVTGTRIAAGMWPH